MFPVKDVKNEEIVFTTTDIKPEVSDSFEMEHWTTISSSNVDRDCSLVCQPSVKSEPDDILFERIDVVEDLVDYPELVVGHHENEEFIVHDLPYISKCKPETDDDLPDSIPELKRIIEENKCQMSRYLVEMEYLNYQVKMLTQSLNKSNKSSMENEINGLKSYICLLSTNNTKLKDEVKTLRDLVVKEETKKKRKKTSKKLIYFNNNTMIMRIKNAESEFGHLRKKVQLLRKDNATLNSALSKTSKNLSDYRKRHIQMTNELKVIRTKYTEAMTELSKQKEQSANLRVRCESMGEKNDGGEK